MGEIAWTTHGTIRYANITKEMICYTKIILNRHVMVKKLTVKQENGRAVSPNNVQSMSTNLQKKFAKVMILVNEVLDFWTTFFYKL